MVKRYRFVAQTQTDGKVDRVFDSAECVNASDYDKLMADFLRYRSALYTANGFLIQLGREPVKLEYPQSETEGKSCSDARPQGQEDP